VFFQFSGGDGFRADDVRDEPFSTMQRGLGWGGGEGGGDECERVMCNTISGFKVRQMTPADNGVVKTVKYKNKTYTRNTHTFNIYIYILKWFI